MSADQVSESERSESEQENNAVKIRVGAPFHCPSCGTKARSVRCIYAITSIRCQFCGAKMQFVRSGALFWIYRCVDLAIIPLLIWLAVAMSAEATIAVLGYAILGTLYFIWSSRRYGYLRLPQEDSWSP